MDVAMPTLVDLCLSLVIRKLSSFSSLQSLPIDVIDLILEEINCPTQPPHVPMQLEHDELQMFYEVRLLRMDISKQTGTDATTWLKNLRGTTLGSSLIQLNLSNTNITDSALALLSCLPCLKHIALSSCPNIRGYGLKNVNCNLSFLNVRNCAKFNGDSLAVIPFKCTLDTLILSGTSLEDRHLAILPSFKSLIKLRLNFCDKISHKGLVYIAQLPNLRFLSMSHCYELGKPYQDFLEQPNQDSPFLSFPPLHSLNLSFCELRHNSLPFLQCIAQGKFSNMQSLKLSNNTLPTDFFLTLASLCTQGTLRSLKLIDLSHSTQLTNPEVKNYVIHQLRNPLHLPDIETIKASSGRESCSIPVTPIPNDSHFTLNFPPPNPNVRQNTRPLGPMIGPSVNRMSTITNTLTNIPAPIITPPVISRPQIVNPLRSDPTRDLALTRYQAPIASSGSALLNKTSNKLVLLGEDEAFQAVIVQRELEKRHFSVIVAKNGRSALDMYIQRPDIALVLMDVFMPVMDGLTSIKLIRKFEEETKRRRTTIVIVTSNPRHTRALSSSSLQPYDCLTEAGGDAFIQKPFKYTHLDPIVPLLT
eukprot:TRINITY_DN4090_c0_g1_i2.p1 TRINITY_DN4090_c0_g1~~TRINITY_DN4090_c0_g1_i2.p1  ORF type:complete len:588 (-),score=82.75 TRINITY_DN4090_c0_g1_i2:190-1953(-)